MRLVTTILATIAALALAAPVFAGSDEMATGADAEKMEQIDAKQGEVQPPAKDADPKKEQDEKADVTSKKKSE